MKASVLQTGRGHCNAKRALRAGVLVAMLDAAFAVLVYAIVLEVATPVQVFQSIASGILGSAASAGGLAAAVLGVVLHVMIAYGWVLVYLAIYRLSTGLRRATRTAWGAAKAGLVFGVGIWLVMNFLVKPMGGISPTPAGSALFAAMLVGHVVIVGWPIALIVRPGAVPRRPSLNRNTSETV